MATLPCDFIFVERRQLRVFQAPKFGFRASARLSHGFRTPKNPLTVAFSTSVTRIDHCNFSLDNGMGLGKYLPRGDPPVSDRSQIQPQAVELNALETNGLAGNNIGSLSSGENESLDNAHKMFDQIPSRILPNYAAQIRSCCRSEQYEQLFSVFGSMIEDGVLPDEYLVTTILKSYSSMKLLKGGKMIHGYVLRKDMVSDVFIGNALISLYSNCGELRSSINVFDSMKVKDVVSWTSLVSAYMNEDLLDEAKEIFNSMKLNGVKPDIISWNALMSGFARNGETALARQLLEDMKQEGLEPRVNSWNGIISGYVQHGIFEDAIDVLHDMLYFPEKPNSVTIASVLPACASLEDLYLGRAIHGYALKLDLDRNFHVEGSLIGMYSKCQRIDYAEKVFNQAENKNTSVWNEMIAAYVDDGQMRKALKLFRLMQNKGLKPDEITYNTLLAGHARNRQIGDVCKLLSEMVHMSLNPTIISWNILISGFQQSGLGYEALNVFRNLQCGIFPPILRGTAIANSTSVASALAACSDLNLWGQGKEIHGYAMRKGFHSNIYVSNALVDMYMKGKDVESAITIFSRTLDRNTVSWNNFIAGCVKNRQLEMVLKLFNQMLEEGHKPSLITFFILLPAISELGTLRLGRQLHAFIVKSQFQDLDNNLTSALAGMYAKRGSIAESKRVLNSR